MTSWVRAAGLRALPALLADLGTDPDELFARHGIDVALLEQPDAVVPSAPATRLLEDAARCSGHRDLGLRLAAVQDLAVLGLPAVAIENAATLGEAFTLAERYLPLHSPGMRIGIGPDPRGRQDVVGLVYDHEDPVPRDIPQATGAALGLMHRAVLALAGGPYGLRSVHLPHPPLVPAGRYEEFFGAPVVFGAPEAALRVPVTLADRPLRGRNELVSRLAQEHLGTLAPVDGSTGATVSRLLEQDLAGRTPTLAELARRLGLHERTLQRRLAAEGTRFDQLLDGARRTAAHRLLRGSDLTMPQVAAAVGLSEQSALSRAVRRWFGMTPSELRAGAGGPGG